MGDGNREFWGRRSTLNAVYSVGRPWPVDADRPVLRASSRVIGDQLLLRMAQFQALLGLLNQRQILGCGSPGAYWSQSCCVSGPTSAHIVE